MRGKEMENGTKVVLCHQSGLMFIKNGDKGIIIKHVPGRTAPYNVLIDGRIWYLMRYDFRKEPGMLTSCIYLIEWDEMQGDPGSGMSGWVTQSDCLCPGGEHNDAIEHYEECDEGCPGYFGWLPRVCKKHGEYDHRDGCQSCLADSYEEAERGEAKYQEDMVEQEALAEALDGTGVHWDQVG